MLSTYNNYETEPIKIGKYVIIEMYKDNIAENNKIGYHILSPNAIPKNQTTSDYITSLAQSKKPAGYENLKILYDRAGSSDTDFNNKIKDANIKTSLEVIQEYSNIWKDEQELKETYLNQKNVFSFLHV